MTEAVITDIAGKIIDNLVPQVLENVGKLWGLGHELKVLRDTICILWPVLELAEEQYYRHPKMQDWLEKLKDAFYNAHDVLEEFNIEALRRESRGHKEISKEVRTFFSGRNQLAFKMKMSYKLRGVRERIEAIKADRGFLLDERNMDLRVQREWRKREVKHSFIREGDIRGRNDDKKTVMNFLLDLDVKECVSILPIVGIGGLGKTALAQGAYNDGMVSGNFDLKMWVCVSNDFDVKSIVKNIIACAKGEPNEVAMELLQRELRKEIEGKRYLLVLDDLWITENETWLRLKTLLMKGNRGSKILITTRLPSVAKITGTVPPHFLGGLSESASLDLLMQVAGRENEGIQDPEMLAIGKEIIRKCFGIPSVIRSVGSLLFFMTTKSEWLHFKDHELPQVSQRETIEAPEADGGILSDERIVDLPVEGEWRKREETHSFILKGDIMGRDDDKKTVMEFLLDSNVKKNVSILPIVGIAGIGKTTLAQRVYNDEMVNENFDLKMWVCVSNDFDMKKIVKNIIVCAKKKEPAEVAMEGLQSELRAEIYGKKYLLVLDDLWNAESETWLSLITSLGKAARGSKILVTTRLPLVAKITGTVPPHFLGGLSENASLDLLMHMAGRKVEKIQNSDMLAIGKEIVRECSGVPLVIRTIGNLLYFKKTKSEWLHFKDHELAQVSQKTESIEDHELAQVSQKTESIKSALTKSKRLHFKDHELAQVSQKTKSIEDHELAQVSQKTESIKSVLTKSKRLHFKDHELAQVSQKTKSIEDHELAQVSQKTESINSVLTKSERLHFKDHELAQVSQKTKSIKDHELAQVSQKTESIKSVLRLSYDRLPSHLKQCFAFCSLFPKDYELKKQTLINLWMAEGFIQPSNGGQQLEDIADGYFMDLLWGNFFQDFKKDPFTNEETCKMPALMHDLACLVAGSECWVACKDTKSILERTHHISHGLTSNLMGKLPIPGSIASSLRTFLSVRTNHEMEQREPTSEADLRQLIQSFKRLRILDLHAAIVKKVPRSICELKHLTYLDLSHNNALKRLPTSITRLHNLQTLNLQGCTALEELPRDIRKLVNLRNLDIDHCYSLSYVPRGLEQLISLRKLTRFILPKGKALTENYCGLGELNRLNDLRGSLSIENLGHSTDAIEEYRAGNLIQKHSLESLILKWGYLNTDGAAIGNTDEALLDRLRPHSNLQKLTIDGYEGNSFPNWMKVSLVNSLPNLVEVRLLRCGRCKLLPQLGRLPHLKSLKIWRLAELENIDLDHSPTSTTSFPSLLRLEIRYCENLKAMPPTPCLEELILKEVNRELTNQIAGPNKLKSLDISQMDIDCLPEECLQSLTSLERLSISECPQLTSFSHGIRHLSNLLHLSFSNCEELDLSKDESDNILDLQGFKSLRFVDILGVPKLASLPRRLLHVSNLERLSITKCLNLKALPEQIEDLQSLQQLKIIRCPLLTSLPEGMQRLTSLSHLTIAGCPNLEQRCKEDTGEDWEKIAHIPHRTHKLEYYERHL